MDRTIRRWPTIAGFSSAAVVLLLIGAAIGIGVEHHRSAADRVNRPSVTDVGFAQDMAAHHDQAILMARSVPASADAEVRTLAGRIVTAQLSEVATLRGWLTWFDEPMTSPNPMSWMPATTGHSHSAPTSGVEQPPMPGMASVAELTKLAQLTGTAASIFFLQLMIRHHRGGLQMAQAAYDAEDASTPTKQLALSMIADQGTEIGQLTMLLVARGARPLD